MPIEFIPGNHPVTKPVNGDSQQQGVKANAQQHVQQDKKPPRSDDTVSITSTAARLQEFVGNLEEIPVIDASRVEALKQDITEGRYDVDSGRLAKNLLDSEIEFFHNSKG